MIIVRIRSRDGLERVTVPDPLSATVATLKSLIEYNLHVPVASQILSRNHNVLLARTLEQAFAMSDLADPCVPLSALGIYHGSVVFLAYQGERNVPPATRVTPANSFGRVMTLDDLARQEAPSAVNGQTLALTLQPRRPNVDDLVDAMNSQFRL